MNFTHDYLDDFYDIHAPENGYKVGNARVDFIMNFTEFMRDTFDMKELTAKSIAYAVFYRMYDHALSYHTPIHVLSMFQFADKINNEGAPSFFDLGPCEQLAIWFHDSVYVPTAGEGENEFNSTMFMNAMLKPFVKDKRILAEAGEMIGETAYHMGPEFPMDGYGYIRAVVLDLDLSSFSFEYEKFAKVSELVAKEYREVYTPDEFIAGRKAFLEKLLTKGFIYRTPYFRERFEDRAKDNVTRAIKDLATT